MTEYRRMLTEVQMQDFALQEVDLFLDTHGNNKGALDYFNRHQKLAKKARTEFESRFGPLQYQDRSNIESWEWTESPWPWECEE